MLKQMRWVTATLLCGLTSVSWADAARLEALNQLLHSAPPQYVMDDQPYEIDPKFLQEQYQVTWASLPQFNFTSKELKQYRQPLQVELTVVASTGMIVSSKILKSSGSKLIDQRVLLAVQAARLERIALVDQNLTYKLVQDFKLNPS